MAKYLSILEFVSTLDKEYKHINYFNTANANYIITLYEVLDNYARKTKTSTITKMEELLFGKDNSKKVLVVSIIFPKETSKRDLMIFKNILEEKDCKLIVFNEKMKKIDFEINKKEYLNVNLK